MRSALGILLWLTVVSPGAAEALMGDGPGCKDKAIGARLTQLTDADPEYIAIWAKGMQDQSCRGFSAGADVTVIERADGMACVRTAEDAECFWVSDRMAP